MTLLYCTYLCMYMCVAVDVYCRYICTCYCTSSLCGIIIDVCTTYAITSAPDAMLQIVCLILSWRQDLHWLFLALIYGGVM